MPQAVRDVIWVIKLSRIYETVDFAVGNREESQAAMRRSSKGRGLSVRSGKKVTDPQQNE